MAPKTDGSSIAMLQALRAGRPVVSSPTIGASEWMIQYSGGFIAKDFAKNSLFRETQQALQITLLEDDVSKCRKQISELANLARNVEIALARL
jgi:glycosyltransferase involved in cell wall biosynthesis